jgi:(E)-4-hydroxy-3-methylbut-2-enyl-diphosphate synthase
MKKNQYCKDLAHYKCLETPEVYIGHIPMGASHPIRIQSMTNTNTNNTKASVRQIIKIANAGADFVRLTTRTVKEAENLRNIKQALKNKGYKIPLVADVHFNPKIAEKAAEIVEKVRINPGNYGFKETGKNDFKQVRKTFEKLIEVCKKHNTAIRIGVNHGSLSQRIMDEYGDTPEGMVQSAIEFLEICQQNNFHKIVVSLKSSNTRVMVHSNRLLINQMLKKHLLYPVHLGVTEAGEGEDGRIKSAVGIGTLLTDGIGDTIRVSLTESPEKEIPVARKIIDYILSKTDHETFPEIKSNPIDPFHYKKRETISLSSFTSHEIPVGMVLNKKMNKEDYSHLKSMKPDMLLISRAFVSSEMADVPRLVPFSQWNKKMEPTVLPYFYSVDQFLESKIKSNIFNFLFITIDELDDLKKLQNKDKAALILQSLSNNPAIEQRRIIFELILNNLKIPVIVSGSYNEKKEEDLQIKSAIDFGPLFIDGLSEGIVIENTGNLPVKKILEISLGILQASRIRISKTEFISCPGCGRTQFDLEKTTKEVRQKLGHLKGLKIAVMGCIVNGPGEMADADYGYVGSGKGKVSLYKNKNLVKKNIREEDALSELIELIKENGDWKEA